MKSKIYVYLIIVISLFFSFSLDANAESYIVEPYSEENIKSSCPESGEINFSCGDFKKIRSCKSIPIEIGECNMTASDEYCIKTHIFIYEIGYFEFGHVSSVYAGMGFNFPNVSYKRYVYWDYYRADGGEIRLLDARKGLESSGVRLTDIDIESYKEELDRSAKEAFEKYFEEDYGIEFFDNNIVVKANDSNIMKNKLVDVSGNWEKINDGLIKVKKVDETLEILDLIKVENDGGKWKLVNPEAIKRKKVDENWVIEAPEEIKVKEIDGNWFIDGTVDVKMVNEYNAVGSSAIIGAGEISGISQKFVYNFCDAYVKLNGSDSSKVEYICDDVSLGSEYDKYSGGYSKYFVPLLFLDDPDTKEVEKFKFNIKNMNDTDNYLNISGTCDIEVVDGLFRYGEDNKIEPRYSYRSIDVNNPFPDINVAYNWRKAVNWEIIGDDVNIDFSRIRKSYENGFYYKVVLVNGHSDDGEISINSIENVNYNDWSKISFSGESSFLDEVGFYKNNSNSYCGIGRFNDECDIYRRIGDS